MTQEQKRIKLAEAGGWKVHPNDRFIVIPPNSPHSVQPLSTIPDYFNDLNAVHELEKTIERLCKEGDYWFHLRELCAFPDAESDWNKVYFFTAVHATAAQRCEAIGKTLNLW
jgi:hypothetical protein